MHCYMTVLLKLQEPYQPFDGDTVPYFRTTHLKNYDSPDFIFCDLKRLKVLFVTYSVKQNIISSEMDLIDESFITRKQMHLH